MLWMWLLACGDKSTDSAMEDTTIDATMTLVSISNRPQIEIPIYADETMQYTEEDGTATLTIPASKPFAIVAEENDSLTHRYVGLSTDRNWALEALFLDRGSWNSMLGNLDLIDEVGTGHIWVAVTNGNFLPIEGASVSLTSGTSDEPFTLLQTNVPWPGNTVEADGRGWIMFPNVTTGDVSLSVTTPEEQTCGVFVGGALDNAFSTTVYADTATIFWFICQ
jgi:hypothetical protein